MDFDEALFAVYIAALLSVAWFFNPFDKILKAWRSWNGLQGRLPEGVRRFSEIPGPRGLPYFGSVIQHIINAKSIQLMATQEKLFEHYGPIFKETVMGRTQVYVKRPTDVEAVFKGEGRYPKLASDMLEPLREYFTGRNMVLASLGLLDDEDWGRLRKAMAPKLLRPKDVRENLESFSCITRDAIKHMVTIRGTAGLENEIPDLEEVLLKFAAETMGIVVFDLRVGLFNDPPNRETAEMVKSINESFVLMRKLNGGLERLLLQYTCFKSSTYKKLCDNLDAVLRIGHKFVNTRMKKLKEMAEGGEEFVENQAVPLLTFLLTKGELELEEITLNSIMMFRAGIEMTGTTALWLLYELARNPRVQEKVYEEVSLLVRPDEDFTPESFAKLNYMKACVKETLRLYPDPLPWSRVLVRDAVLSGYHAPAGTSVIYSNFLAGRASELFPNPLEFKPERWLNTDKNGIHPYASIPFGLGPRMCIGRRLAETELYLLAAKVIQRFVLEYHEEPVELTSEFLVVPDRPMRIKFIDRQANDYDQGP